MEDEAGLDASYPFSYKTTQTPLLCFCWPIKTINVVMGFFSLERVLSVFQAVNCTFLHNNLLLIKQQKQKRNCVFIFQALCARANDFDLKTLVLQNLELSMRKPRTLFPHSHTVPTTSLHSLLVIFCHFEV